MTIHSSGQKYGARSGGQTISLSIFQKRFLARRKQISWQLAGGINGQMPTSTGYERQPEIDRACTGIEHKE